MTSILPPHTRIRGLIMCVHAAPSAAEMELVIAAIAAALLDGFRR